MNVKNSFFQEHHVLKNSSSVINDEGGITLGSVVRFELYAKIKSVLLFFFETFLFCELPETI